MEREFLDRGPWITHLDQLRSFLTEQLKELSEDQESALAERRKNNLANVSDASVELEEFKSLYEALLDVVDGSALFDQWVPSFSLSHPDFSLHNILVGYDEPTRILAVIDWEGARVQPWVSLWLLLGYSFD
jgi:aminoglycoside phosphotransferase (APT) family kinase protein